MPQNGNVICECHIQDGLEDISVTELSALLGSCIADECAIDIEDCRQVLLNAMDDIHFHLEMAERLSPDEDPIVDVEAPDEAILTIVDYAQLRIDEHIVEVLIEMDLSDGMIFRVLSL